MGRNNTFTLTGTVVAGPFHKTTSQGKAFKVVHLKVDESYESNGQHVQRDTVFEISNWKNAFDSLQVGAFVTMTGDLRSSAGRDGYFTNLSAWKVEASGVTHPAPPMQQPAHFTQNPPHHGPGGHAQPNPYQPAPQAAPQPQQHQPVPHGGNSPLPF